MYGKNIKINHGTQWMTTMYIQEVPTWLILRSLFEFARLDVNVRIL